MAFVKALTSVPVMLDGKELIVTLALIYLVVCMETAVVKDWHVYAMIRLHGKEDFVIFLFATIASTANVLPLANASAILDGQDPIVINAWH